MYGKELKQVHNTLKRFSKETPHLIGKGALIRSKYAKFNSITQTDWKASKEKTLKDNINN
jgi:hypothetical protein